MNHTENIFNLLDSSEKELISKYFITVETFSNGEKPYLESGRGNIFHVRNCTIMVLNPSSCSEGHPESFHTGITLLNKKAGKKPQF